jgi:hypothetical protein
MKKLLWAFMALMISAQAHGAITAAQKYELNHMNGVAFKHQLGTLLDAADTVDTADITAGAVTSAKIWTGRSSKPTWRLKPARVFRSSGWPKRFTIARSVVPLERIPLGSLCPPRLWSLDPTCTSRLSSRIRGLARSQFPAKTRTTSKRPLTSAQSQLTPWSKVQVLAQRQQ